MTHTLEIRSADLGGVFRDATPPAGYDLQHTRKLDDLFGEFGEPQLVAELPYLVLALKDAGLVEWVRSKAYTALWDWLVAHLLRTPPPPGKPPPSVSIDIKDADGNLRASVVVAQGSADTFEEALGEFKKRVLADGSTEEWIRVMVKGRPPRES